MDLEEKKISADAVLTETEAVLTEVVLTEAAAGADQVCTARFARSAAMNAKCRSGHPEINRFSAQIVSRNRPEAGEEIGLEKAVFLDRLLAGRKKCFPRCAINAEKIANCHFSLVPASRFFAVIALAKNQADAMAVPM